MKKALRIRFHVWMLMIGLILIGVVFWAVDAVRMARRSAHYVRLADALERQEQYCREVVAMVPAARSRRDEEEWDDPYLHDPALAQKMIPYLAGWRQTLLRASRRPREPLPPYPPPP
jgi:hypothetical protein